jgi:hypothetical protein
VRARAHVCVSVFRYMCLRNSAQLTHFACNPKCGAFVSVRPDISSRDSTCNSLLSGIAAGVLKTVLLALLVILVV